MAVCKSEGCGASIIWALTENGKPVPLDKKGEKRYVLIPKEGSGDPVVQLRTTYSSHFVTCPDADKFRKSKKAETGEKEKA